MVSGSKALQGNAKVKCWKSHCSFHSTPMCQTCHMNFDNSKEAVARQITVSNICYTPFVLFIASCIACVRIQYNIILVLYSIVSYCYHLQQQHPIDTLYHSYKQQQQQQ